MIRWFSISNGCMDLKLEPGLLVIIVSCRFSKESG